VFNHPTNSEREYVLSYLIYNSVLFTHHLWQYGILFGTKRSIDGLPEPKTHSEDMVDTCGNGDYPRSQPGYRHPLLFSDEKGSSHNYALFE
jgi:hypothetical protein